MVALLGSSGSQVATNFLKLFFKGASAKKPWCCEIN